MESSLLITIKSMAKLLLTMIILSHLLEVLAVSLTRWVGFSGVVSSIS